MAEVTRYVTPVFRLSFPNLFEAHAMDEQSKPKFGLTAVWNPAKFTEADKKRWKAIMAALDAESKRAFKKAWKDLPANFKTGVRDGAEKANLEGFGEGTKFANITTKMRPGVIDAGKSKIGPEEGNADDIYPGCYCRATVTVYSYDNKGKGVALGLMNVQKVADGERLDSRTDAAEDFEDDIDGEWLEQEEGSEEFLD
jgi:hypothetical protein